MVTAKADYSLLDKYYDLWLAGEDSRSIQAKLEMNDNKFNDYTSLFLHHCRVKSGMAAREALHNGEVPAIIELTSERRKKFLEYVSLGLGYDKASSMMAVPLVTVLDYWFVEDPTFKIEAQHAVDQLNADITLSLASRAKGLKSESKTVTVVEGEDLDGKHKSTTTSTTTRFIAGDVNAQKFWLINRCPDAFSLDGTVNRKSNKGAILDAIESMLSPSGENDVAELEERFE